MDWLATAAFLSPIICLLVLPSWRAAIIIIASVVGLAAAVVINDWNSSWRMETLSNTALALAQFVPLALAVTFLRLRFGKRAP